MKAWLSAVALSFILLHNEATQSQNAVGAFSTPIRRGTARSVSHGMTSPSSAPCVDSALFRCQRQKNEPLQQFQARSLRRWDRMSQLASKLNRRMKRCAILLCAITMLSFGTVSEPAHAVSAPTTSIERIVDGYVQDNMFNDDRYDPIESAYREAVQDRASGEHQQALSQTVSTVLGENKVEAIVKDTKEWKSVLGSTILKGIRTVSSKLSTTFGLSDSTALAIVAFFITGAVPFTLSFAGMMAGDIAKRNMNKTMKERYGDTYSVDATIKTSQPDDADEDDDDDEDDEDDEEDDDDDDDEDDGSGKK